MKNKRIFSFSLMLVLIFLIVGLSAVSAEEVSDDIATSDLDLLSTDSVSIDFESIDANLDDNLNHDSSSKIKSDGTKTSSDLQKLISDAKNGTVNLGNDEFVNVSNINIDKDIKIVGKNAVISTAGNSKPVFNIKKGLSAISISGIEFKVHNGDVLVKAIASNSTDPLSIETPNIEITKNVVTKADSKVVAESVTVLELDSERGVLAPNKNIKVSGNTLENGVNSFNFVVSSVVNSTDAHVGPGGDIASKKESKIQYNDMKTVAVNQKIEGRAGKYFEVNLTDGAGKPLADRLVQIGFNGAIYNRTTNATGGARLQINLGYKGTYTFAVSFLGDENYNGSFIVAKIDVSTQKTKLATSSKTYKASAKTKTLTATLKDASGHTINGKKVTFTVNGKSYTATTNSKGVATVKVSLSTKKTYSFTAKYAGDDMYAASSASGKVTIK